MKRISFIFSTVAILLLSRLCCSALQWDTTELVVPCSLEDKTVQAVYSFTNTSGETVVITDVRHSCGCTTSGLEKTVIDPGESGVLVVSMSTKGMKGEQAKTVSVYTSEDPDNPDILYLYTDIPVRFELTPAILAWKFRGEMEVRRASLRIHQDLEFTPAQIKLVVNDRDKVGIPFEAAVKKGSGPHDVTIEVLPQALEKMGHNYLEVYFIYNDEPEKIGDIYLVVN
jgi:hypothetical protein